MIQADHIFYGPGEPLDIAKKKDIAQYGPQILWPGRTTNFMVRADPRKQLNTDHIFYGPGGP